MDILVKKQQYKLVDIIFWTALILFTNPGGIQQTLGIFEIIDRINLNDVLFLALLFCFLFIKGYKRSEHKDTILLNISILIFLIYYFVVFGFITPQLRETNVDVVFNLYKLRFALYSSMIFYFSFSFFKRGWSLFLTLFLISSIVILLLFLQSFVSGFEILPYTVFSRGFIDQDRYILLDYGVMPFLTPLGAAVLIFKYKKKNSKLIILGLILINLVWLISLTRRHIMGFVITFIIGLLIFSYINRSKITQYFRVALFSFFMIVIVGLIFPTYVRSGYVLVKSTINVIKTGSNITGLRDERLALFGREKMVEEFTKHPLLGTGFNNLWRTSEGERYGYEASDYPFQSALAMSGILGLLFYLPVYIILIRALLRDLKTFRALRASQRNIDQISVILLGLMIYFIHTLILYMNWFSPVSNAESVSVFYILLGWYFALREVFYQNLHTTHFCTDGKSINNNIEL